MVDRVLLIRPVRHFVRGPISLARAAVMPLKSTNTFTPFFTATPISAFAIPQAILAMFMNPKLSICCSTLWPIVSLTNGVG